jgi:hypothetical protein
MGSEFAVWDSSINNQHNYKYFGVILQTHKVMMYIFFVHLFTYMANSGMSIVPAISCMMRRVLSHGTFRLLVEDASLQHMKNVVNITAL